MRSEMRRYSLDQIGLNIVNGENVEKSQNPSETTPRNSIDEHENNAIKQASRNKRQSKDADYIKIDYDDLEFYERCGRGSYGTVFRGLWKSRSKIVAIKKLIQLQTEAEILSSCSHRNIIQFFGIVNRESSFCIVTEYAEHGSLYEFIKQHDIYDEFGLALILNWAHDIALGMNYLHSEAPMRIIHRDLKSNNVLITGNDLICKICDFGSSRFGLQTTRMTFTGTFPWMSPEMIQSKPANQLTDVWSYGVVLWEIITGEVPFKGIDEFQIASLVVEKSYRLPIPNGCPPVMTTLMQLCWQEEPKLRPTFKQILVTLDQIEFDDEVKAEMDNLLNRNRPKWETEIEEAFEKLKKIENDLQIKEKLLEARERRLREMEMELIANANKLTLEDHDVNTWTETDVYEWINKLGKKIKELESYNNIFINHNINGRRLLIMNKDDLRNIGIKSEGLIIDLFHEIQTLKIENMRLLNFPPLRSSSINRSQGQPKTSVSFVLLIGCHMIESTSIENSKWKMYADFDIEPSSEQSRPIDIVNWIRDVKFVNKSTFDQYNLNKPPYIMKNWVKGFSNDTKIICTVTYEDKVIQPRKTSIEYALYSNRAQSEQVVLTLEDEISNGSSLIDLSLKTSNSSNISSTSNSIIQLQQTLNQSPGLISNSGPIAPFTQENAWKKRNLENSVSIPQQSESNSSDLWSGVVTGKYRTQEKAPPPTLKKQISEQQFKPVKTELNSTKRPDESARFQSHKLTRSQTCQDYPRRFSNSSNDSNSSNKTSNTSSNGTRKSADHSWSIKSPVQSSKPPRNFGSNKRRNLSGFGRGNLATIKAENSLDLAENSKFRESEKPFFF